MDPDRIGAFGHSAGAHLVMMLALCPASAGLEGDGGWNEYSSRVNAAAAGATPTRVLACETLSGPDLKAANTFAQPKNVVPRPLDAPQPSSKMTFKLPARSYTVANLAATIVTHAPQAAIGLKKQTVVGSRGDVCHSCRRMGGDNLC